MSENVIFYPGRLESIGGGSYDGRSAHRPVDWPSLQTSIVFKSSERQEAFTQCRNRQASVQYKKYVKLSLEHCSLSETASKSVAFAHIGLTVVFTLKVKGKQNGIYSERQETCLEI